MTATILIPTHDHGPMLHHAIRSVLNQTVQDFQLFVIGDGATSEGRAVVLPYADTDSRIRFFDHPKGPRHGEIYRHQALREATGDIVCYLSDDDLWLPGHVEYMRELLRHADFAHVLPIVIRPTGDVSLHSGTFSRAEAREWIDSGKNFVPLSAAGHTLAFYRDLPHGWRTTPEGISTDTYMWQQILGVSGCRSRSGLRPTLLNFPSASRKAWSIQQRLSELQEWEKAISKPDCETTLTRSALDFLVRQRVQSDLEAEELRGEIDTMKEDITWRVRNGIVSLPLLGSVVAWAAKAIFRRGSH